VNSRPTCFFKRGSPAQAPYSLPRCIAVPDPSWHVLSCIPPPLYDISCINAQPISDPPCHDAQKGSRQNIRRIVDIQVQSGEGYQHGKHQGWDPKSVPAEIERRSCCEGGAGMAGGEGKISRPGNEKLNSCIYVTGTK